MLDHEFRLKVSFTQLRVQNDCRSSCNCAQYTQLPGTQSIFTGVGGMGGGGLRLHTYVHNYRCIKIFRRNVPPGRPYRTIRWACLTENVVFCEFVNPKSLFVYSWIPHLND